MELLLFMIGGAVYTLLEVLWKGQSHWSMFLLGGICFVIMGLLNEYKIPWHWCLLRQSIVSACIITVFEFFTGCIVNLWLGWDVWDYSDLPFNILGQVCLYFFFLWILLSMVGIVSDDWIRYWRYLLIMKWDPWKLEETKPRERPHYKLI